MTAGQMISALQTGIRLGHYSKDDILTVATSTTGINQDGQIEVESVAMEIWNPGRNVHLKGPILEVKGRVKVNTK